MILFFLYQDLNIEITKQDLPAACAMGIWFLSAKKGKGGRRREREKSERRGTKTQTNAVISFSHPKV